VKTAGWIIAVLVLVALGWLARDSRLRAAEARAEIAALQLDLDAAKAQATADSLRADSLALEAVRLDSLRAVTEAEARVRAARLTRQADSLSRRVSELLEGTEAAEEVEALLGEIRASYEARISDLEGVILQGRRIEQTLRAQVVAEQEVALSLRSALALAEQQRDRCLDAMSPGLWDRIRANIGPLAGATVLGLVVGLTAR
jgi:hypothetical protein